MEGPLKGIRALELAAMQNGRRAVTFWRHGCRSNQNRRPGSGDMSRGSRHTGTFGLRTKE
jgi:hypothetical protein